MSELTEHERAAFAIVDDALRTYPLAPAPPTLVPRLTARLRALAPAPRFRLMWIDYALSLFLAGMLALGILLWHSIPPQTFWRVELQFLYLTQVASVTPLWPALLAGLLLAAWAGLTAAAVFGRAQHRTAN